MSRMITLFLAIIFFTLTLTAQDKSLYLDSASTYMEMKNYKAAQSYAEKALSEIEKKSGRSSEDYVSTIKLLIQTSLFQKNLSKALYYAKIDSSLAIGMQGKDTNYLTTLNYLDYIYKELNLNDNSIIINEERLKVKSYLFGEHSDEYIRSLNNLAKTYYRTGNYEKAEPLFRRMAKFYEDSGRYETLENARTQNNLGLICLELGKYPEAELRLDKSLSILKKLKLETSPDYISALQNLANLYYYAGKLINAETTFEDLLGRIISQFRKESADYIDAASSFALVLIETGEFEKAEGLINECLWLSGKLNLKNSILYAGVVNNQGILNASLGRYSDAAANYKEAYDLRKTFLGDTHPLTLISLNNYAVSEIRNGNYQLAEELFKKILNQKQKKLGIDNKSYLISLNNLAGLQFEQGKPAETFKTLKSALEIDSAKKDSGIVSELITKSNLCNFFLKAGDFANSLSYGESVIKTQLNINQSSLYRNTLVNTALAVQFSGNYGLARQLMLNALDLDCDLIDKSYAFMSTSERENFSQVLRNHFEKFNYFALHCDTADIELIDKMFYYNQKFKGILTEYMRYFNIRSKISKDSSGAKAFKDWMDINSYITKASSWDLTDNDHRMLDSLKIISNTLEKKIIEKIQIKDLKLSYKSNEVRESLDDNEAFILTLRIRDYGKVKHKLNRKFEYYDFTDSVIYAFLIIKPESEIGPQLVLIENGREIEDRIMKEYRELIAYQKMPAKKRYARLEDIDRKSTDLFRTLWKKVNDQIKGCKKVFFVPDGIYYHLNPETLRNPESGKYLLDEYEVRILSSVNDLFDKSSGSENKKLDASVFGDPKFRLDSTEYAANMDYPNHTGILLSQRSFDLIRNGITPLPGTRAEAEEVTGLLESGKWKVETFIGDKATETRLKSLHNPRLLHIATHGKFFGEDEPLDEVDYSESIRGYKNPMQNSFLLFSGVENYFDPFSARFNNDDGILNAEEASCLDLAGTELVVLSACETGLGELNNGEGIHGFRSALRIAGVQNMIFSLWSVSDIATKELMVEFYRNWLGGSPLHESLINAKKKIRSKFPEFYYWGAFVMVGE